MNNLQALQLSRDLSTMQSTVVTLLRHLEPVADESDRVLYARWYCKRAISQQIVSEAEPPAVPAAPVSAAAPVAEAPSWADQVEKYLRRKRDERIVVAAGASPAQDRQGRREQALTVSSLALSAPVPRGQESPGEAPDAIADVLLRSGETWIIRSDENQPLPTLMEFGIGHLPLAMPRVVGVLGRDPARLDLSGFVARVIGVTPARALSEADLERGYQVLAGQAGRPMTLVIDAAERLTSDVIHFIQFACICAPTLQVVFITTKEFRHRLNEFAFLRARLQPDLAVACDAEPTRDEPPDETPMQKHDSLASLLSAEPGPAFAFEVENEANEEAECKVLLRAQVCPTGANSIDWIMPEREYRVMSYMGEPTSQAATSTSV